MKRLHDRSLFLLCVIYIIVSFTCIINYEDTEQVGKRVDRPGAKRLPDMLMPSTRHLSENRLLPGISRNQRLDRGKVPWTKLHHIYAWLTGSQISQHTLNIGMDPITSLTSQMKQMMAKHDRVDLGYASFSYKLPRMVNPADVDKFYMNKQNRDDLSRVSVAKLTGVVAMVNDSVIHGDINCGWQTQLHQFTVQSNTKTITHYIDDQILCPLLVPDSAVFQHFIDGVLPKIIQAHALIQAYNASLLIYKPVNDIIYDILEVLNIPPERLVLYNQDDVLQVKKVINTCITPPLHPTLFQEAHKILATPSMPRQRSLVILLARVNNRNPGRLITNYEQVYQLLQKRYGKEHVVVFTGKVTFTETRGVFSKAKVILGVHGGLFYNLLFAPKGTHIIEATPVGGNSIKDRLAHTIFWQLSDILGHIYWRMNELPVNTLLDVRINTHKLVTMLNQIDTAC